MQRLVSELSGELENNIIPFWTSKMVDHKNGGFYGRIDGQNMVHPQADKGVILNSRLLWTFAAMYRFKPTAIYQEMATRAFQYISKNFIDADQGGVYWRVDYLGNPIDKKKQIYAQAFAIYGISEYFRAFADPKSLDMAINLFEKIEINSFDQQHNGYYEAYSQNWQLLDDLRLSEKDANEKKSMNTHLHVLEAYTNLYRVWPETRLKRQLINLIQVFLDKILDTETYHFHLFFDEVWQVRSTTISYGHDVEGSWLLQEAAEAIGDQELIFNVKETALKMVDVALQEGFASDGGIYYEKEGEETDTDKHWWPQAEALVALINAWQISNEQKYLKKAIKSWDFIQKHLVDNKNGEWFNKVDNRGKILSGEDKAGFWKCPYHNSRACIEVIQRLSK